MKTNELELPNANFYFYLCICVAFLNLPKITMYLRLIFGKLYVLQLGEPFN